MKAERAVRAEPSRGSRDVPIDGIDLGSSGDSETTGRGKDSEETVRLERKQHRVVVTGTINRTYIRTY